MALRNTISKYIWTALFTIPCTILGNWIYDHLEGEHFPSYIWSRIFLILFALIFLSLGALFSKYRSKAREFDELKQKLELTDKVMYKYAEDIKKLGNQFKKDFRY